MLATSEVVRLSAYDDLLAQVLEHVGPLHALVLQSTLESKAGYQVGADTYADYVARIVKNNPGKDLGQILARPDVQESLHRVSTKARTIAGTKVDAAWSSGWQLGSSSVRAEATALGLKIPASATSSGSSSYLGSLHTDLDNQRTLFGPRMQASGAQAAAGVTTPDQGAINQPANLAQKRSVVVKDAMGTKGAQIGTRAAASASVAASRAFGESALAEMAAIQAENVGVTVMKVWVCSFGPNTCGTCAALHGSVVSLGDQFDAEATFSSSAPKVYGDLTTPPRHPYCRCRLAIYVDSPEAQATIAAMRATAKTFAAQGNKLAPTTWQSGAPSLTALNSPYMTSADFKIQSDGTFDRAMRRYRGCLLSQAK